MKEGALARAGVALTALVAAALLLAPFGLSDFRLSLLGKFLAFAVLAIGIDLIWGYAGILSLGHGVFFGLGAYAVAMHLKLVASGGRLPDFMSWSGVESLPWFWRPFASPWFALAAAVAVPVLIAVSLGYLTFRNRIRGAFFSILTQALVIVTVTLFIGQQGYTGGTNGLTNFSTFLGFPLYDPNVKIALYYVSLFVLGATYFLCRRMVRGRFGRILIAVRDGENRLRFLGYDPVRYKVFAFGLSAALAGVAGALFVLQEGIISPAQMNIVPSIEMVLWVAIGGRGTLSGAVIGALATNAAKTAFSELYPDGWLFFLGGLFVVVVLLLPGGLVGLWQTLIRTIRRRNERRVSDGRYRTA
ncbi:MAG: urea ABC transporter permease subunit UrtC [Candidatus Reconcilbacillus cellulovorans]|uniref:Urea ABC transporter permease subunit UrtC n=1 Tax=Candidatus Reconcilbacillus cellulovorans TaxID=1906605 RepID=A0A2A6E1U2_9BACL|nr:MAG: urea ABC transporter permease subunit UrtC [Candidatus Reconcilbacillus cellulovorans]